MTLSINTSRPTSKQLPENYCIELSQLGAISLSGEEQSKYLQGQVTCDVNAVTDSSLVNGAHCNAKGKVFSVFRLFNRKGVHLLLQNKASLAPSLAELKKFGVFAKVEISQVSNLSFYGLIGDNAASLIKETFKQLPDSLTPVIQAGTTTLVYIAGAQPRYIVINETAILTEFIQTTQLPIYEQAIWDLLEINEGFATLSSEGIGEYVPQMINVQAIHGISFTKGCYLGQETVARMQYLGKNKRALFSISGNSSAEVNATDVVEMQLGENWRKAGDVIKSYRADDGSQTIQVVLASDIDNSAKLRIKGDESSSLTLNNLPYSLSFEEE